MAKVKIYSTKDCVYCKMLKDYLSSKGVAFEDVVLNEHPEEVQSLLDTCGSMGVPCSHIELDDGRAVNILGFDKAKIDQTLGL